MIEGAAVMTFVPSRSGMHEKAANDMRQTLLYTTPKKGIDCFTQARPYCVTWDLLSHMNSR
jgi:hypothetical protein